MADAAAELDEGGVKRAVKDLFAGAAGGVAQVLIGQFKMIAFIRYLPIAFDCLCFIGSSLHATLSLLFFGVKYAREADILQYTGQPFGKFQPITKVLKESELSFHVQILSKSAFKQALDTPAP